MNMQAPQPGSGQAERSVRRGPGAAVIFLSVLATVTEGDPQQLPGSTQQPPLSKESRYQVLLSALNNNPLPGCAHGSWGGPGFPTGKLSPEGKVTSLRPSAPTFGL